MWFNRTGTLAEIQPAALRLTAHSFIISATFNTDQVMKNDKNWPLPFFADALYMTSVTR